VVIGIQVWDLHLPGCHSLKEKRGTLKPLTAALRQRLNVSVAETATRICGSGRDRVRGRRDGSPGRGGDASHGRPGH
jgi:hypothetical protein